MLAKDKKKDVNFYEWTGFTKREYIEMFDERKSLLRPVAPGIVVNILLPSTQHLTPNHLTKPNHRGNTKRKVSL